ncbi:hypothetical protein B1690_12805 [Geobacillus sp. 46C-IIa]|uniref:winged helix-turn-helix domain-containing protein n=1 Tax=Geobacillus sp. 46C-IIa TaxID=1963025 RepID=UPI0009BDBCA6|nr:hypothetical protein B1690_12805 [Geobacillus sp. 46C-IIa]
MVFRDKLAEEDETYVILDMRRGQAVFHGPHDSVGLPRRLVKLLRYLLENAPKVKRYDAIIANVWGDEEAVRNENVKKMINKLRKKLEQCFSEPTDQIIVNVRGEGYLWNCKIPYRIIVCLDEYEYFI